MPEGPVRGPDSVSEDSDQRTSLHGVLLLKLLQPSLVNSVNRSAENMLRITENEELLTTIEKISAYRNQPLRNRSQLRRIIDALTPQERVRYFHFQRNACLSCEVFLDSADAGFIDQDRFSMAFGWNDVDYEIWEALSLTIGPKTRQRFAKVPRQIVPLKPISAG